MLVSPECAKALDCSDSSWCAQPSASDRLESACVEGEGHEDAVARIMNGSHPIWSDPIRLAVARIMKGRQIGSDQIGLEQAIIVGRVEVE